MANEMMSGLGNLLAQFQQNPEAQMAMLQLGANFMRPPAVGETSASVMSQSLANAFGQYQDLKRKKKEQEFEDIYNPAKLDNLQSQTELNRARAKNPGRSSARPTDTTLLAQAYMNTDPTIKSLDEALIRIHEDKLTDAMIKNVLPNLAFLYGDDAGPMIQEMLENVGRLRKVEPKKGVSKPVDETPSEEPKQGVIGKTLKAAGNLKDSVVDKVSDLVTIKPNQPKPEEREQARTYLKAWLVSQGIPDREPTDQEIDTYIQRLKQQQQLPPAVP